MALARSASRSRTARNVAAALVLLALGALAGAASAAPSAPAPIPGLAISLEQSAAAIPLAGTMGFTGVIRFPQAASSVRARLQVHRASGKLVYQRTQYLDTAVEGTQTFSFSRPLTGLGLEAGVYPATFSIQANINGSDITTQVVVPVRIYDSAKPPITVVVVAKVHARPMGDPSGNFGIDPAVATLAREQIDRIATMVAGDTSARVTLAIAPVTLEEWRRIASDGYRLASGTVVPASDPVPLAYGSTLAHLQQAIGTGRLELVTMGYVDPNLGDLSINRMNADAAVQYDAGLSACFSSIQTTPSVGTVPAGGTVPAPMQSAVETRGVTYAVTDSELTRIGKRPVASGAYPVGGAQLTALVVDAQASRGLEAADASATLAHTFGRLGTPSANQPLVVRIDLDDTVKDATATVGLALTTVETTPWTRLALGESVHAPKGARPVDFSPTVTKNAPVGFWARVRKARADATGLLAVLGPNDDQATVAQTNSLLAESSTWSDPAATWKQAGSGLAFAGAAVDSANSLFSQIKMTAEAVTLANSTGNIPVNIQNGSKQTLSVVLLCKTGGGVRVVGQRLIPTKLAPRETFVEIPIDMGSALYGKLTVQVMAGNVIVTKKTIDVRRSYLDRLALIGGIVVILGGMLIWIVLRVRKSPDVAQTRTRPISDAADQDARYTEADPDRSEGPDTP
ncbi:MAG: hypothetical protein P4L93_07260 [Coriobacteriia bacterium]|nr:hypothetical protein [Coriobacteriia bacterium]